MDMKEFKWHYHQQDHKSVLTKCKFFTVILVKVTEV